jgi:hypothetical protein
MTLTQKLIPHIFNTPRNHPFCIRTDIRELPQLVGDHYLGKLSTWRTGILAYRQRDTYSDTLKKIDGRCLSPAHYSVWKFRL